MKNLNPLDEEHHQNKTFYCLSAVVCVFVVAFRARDRNLVEFIKYNFCCFKKRGKNTKGEELNKFQRW
jgi:hypothetical protein